MSSSDTNRGTPEKLAQLRGQILTGVWTLLNLAFIVMFVCSQWLNLQAVHFLIWAVLWVPTYLSLIYPFTHDTILKADIDLTESRKLWWWVLFFCLSPFIVALVIVMQGKLLGDLIWPLLAVLVAGYVAYRRFMAKYWPSEEEIKSDLPSWINWGKKRNV